MREARRQDEQIAINMVERRLTDQGNEVIEDTSITDNPDWVFSLNGRRIAAECRCINLEAIMEWGNSRISLVHNKCYEIIIPNEPHFWLFRAVKDKESKVKKYKSNSGSEEVWLIAHSELPGGLPFFECDEATLQLLKQAASAIESSFDCIWFVHSECGAHKLWCTGEPKSSFPSLELSKGYPTITNKKGIGTLTKDGFTFDVGPENTIESIILQPLDKRYKI